MTLKSIFLTLSRYTHLEVSQKFGPEKYQAKQREVQGETPKLNEAL